MEIRSAASIAWLCLVASISPRTSAQCDARELHASDGGRNDLFGKSVAVRGARALVGRSDLDLGGGSVYAFEHGVSGWVQVQKLTASDNADSDSFGFSLACTDTAAVVGAIGHDHAGIGGSGAAYVLERDATGWHEVQELLSVGPDAGDSFGFAVAIDGAVIVVSAIGRDTAGMHNAGIAYVFERGPSGWIRTAELVPSDAAPDDTFGSDVAVSGTTIVVGKYRDDGFRGAAYVFEKTSAGWVERAELSASDGVANDSFGWSVAVDGDFVLVGAVLAGASGAAYLFEREPPGWIKRAKLTPADQPASGDFGYEVALLGDTALIAMPGVSAPRPPGAVYVHRREGDRWPFVARISAVNDVGSNAFGVGLAADGETLFVGAPWEDDLGYLSGSAHAYTIPAFASAYGHCAGAGICGNGDPVAGCANSTGRGARLFACGSGSVASDDFTLTADGMVPSRFVVFFRGGATAHVPFGDGFRRVGAGSLGLFRTPPGVVGADGRAMLGPGFLAGSGIVPGESWYFQAWYADPLGPCGSGSNATNAVRASFGP